jgi:integration host factor subunit alpha
MPKTGTLTKARIVEAVKETNGYTQQKAFETVEIMIELIKRSLETGEDVLISNFGKFCVKKKTKRKGRNPATGKDMMLAPRKVVKFQSSRKLREKVNRQKETVKKIRAKDKINFENRQSSNKRDRWPRKKTET